MDQTTNVVPLRKPDARRRRVSVASILALSFGALVLVSVGGVLALTVGANYRNTFDLIGKTANLLVEAMTDSLRDHASRAEDAVTGVADLYEQGDFGIDDEAAMTAALSGALVSVPDASAMLIYDPGFNVRGVFRGSADEDGERPIEDFAREPVKSPEIKAALEMREKVPGLQWGDFALQKGQLYANVSMPLVRNGHTDGWVVAPIDLLVLSTITRDLSTRFETTAFIIDGDDRILAHQRLLQPRGEGWANEPTVPLENFDDPVLAQFAKRQQLEHFSDTSAPDIHFAEIQVPETEDAANGHHVDPDYIVITKTISGYGVRPWTIGAYYPKRALGDEIMRIWQSAAIGLAALVVALIVAVMLGKRLSKPVRAIASQAHLVADFNLDDIKPLPRSRVLEFDDQANAFNAMLTVMFTDIAGFTTLSEQLPGGAGAELLNHHFALQCEAIDAEGGTVDKFLGDGVMAFFGAPDRLKGHGAAAVRAAIAIREALAADNRAAVDDGRPPLRLRIGIHTGRVIVGDIGAADRVNYTIVGDTVNTAQRLETLGRQAVPPETEVGVLVSAATAKRLDDTLKTVRLGDFSVKGRSGSVEVYQLLTPDQVMPAAAHADAVSDR
jgi:adenylate cyclase